MTRLWELDINAGTQKIRFLTCFQMYWLIYVINNLEEEMHSQANKYAEGTNPRQDGQYKGQDSNNNNTEEEAMSEEYSLLMN